MRNKLYALLGVTTTLVLAAAAGLNNYARAADVNTNNAIQSDAIQIAPSIQRIEDNLQPGQTYSRSLEIKNNSNEDHTVKITTATFWVTGEDYSITTGISNSQFGKIANWTDIDQNEVHTIRARSAFTLDYTITVPNDASGGAQRLMVQVNIGGTSDGGFVALETVLNAQVYATVDGDINPSAKLIAQHISGFTTNPHLGAISTIENTGNVDLDATYTLTATDFFTGNLAFSNEGSADNTKILMTESTRTFEQIWPSAPQLGVFNVTQDITVAGETYTKSGIVIICPLWLILLVAAFIAAIVIFFVRKSQTRRSHTR